ncbi:antihemorrhagic factor jMSF isoform X3 [Oncorhynchus kisutch]|uniref:antihemorrhagic factor jMSF isoform X3 n=1 Tax=Oncorhynchus kisutch TaxID=8019 RepID=UPI0012DFE389|nr:antihemorrhagic factor jMSF isoform X3 [Oncorhynchus kisutch]
MNQCKSFLFSCLLSTNFTKKIKEGAGVLFNLTIDVLETKCHVISKKPWKKCEVKDVANVSVYGHCMASISVGKSVELRSYKCAIQQVPATVIVDTCPDCPTVVQLDDPILAETTNLILQKYNRMNRLPNYFTLLNVTGARIQHKAFCTGSHTTLDDGTFQTKLPIEVKCKIFEPEAAKAEEEAHVRGDSGHQSEDEDHKHAHTHLHPYEHHHHPPNSNQASPRLKGSLGIVVVLPPPHVPPPPRASAAASHCPAKRIDLSQEEN